MEKEIMSALIGGLFAILGSLIGFFVLEYKLKKIFHNDLEKIEKTFETNLKQEIFKTNYDYDKRLLEEKLKYYPELFEITQEIGKQKYGEENLRIISEAKEKFLAWRNKGTGFLLLTKNSLDAYNSLKEALKANPGDGKKGYTKEQLEKIFRLRNSLRGALKDDIGIKINNYID